MSSTDDQGAQAAAPAEAPAKHYECVPWADLRRIYEDQTGERNPGDPAMDDRRDETLFVSELLVARARQGLTAPMNLRLPARLLDGYKFTLTAELLGWFARWFDQHVFVEVVPAQLAQILRCRGKLGRAIRTALGELRLGGWLTREPRMRKCAAGCAVRGHAAGGRNHQVPNCYGAGPQLIGARERLRKLLGGAGDVSGWHSMPPVSLPEKRERVAATSNVGRAPASVGNESPAATRNYPDAVPAPSLAPAPRMPEVRTVAPEAPEGEGARPAAPARVLSLCVRERAELRQVPRSAAPPRSGPPNAFLGELLASRAFRDGPTGQLLREIAAEAPLRSGLGSSAGGRACGDVGRLTAVARDGRQPPTVLGNGGDREDPPCVHKTDGDAGPRRGGQP